MLLFVPFLESNYSVKKRLVDIRHRQTFKFRKQMEY